MFSYNPGVRDQSGQLLAAGIERAMGSIGEGLKDYRRKQADKEAEQAAIDYAVKQGWVKDEGEAKVAVKAAGGGPAALSLISQVDQMKRQQEQQQAAARDAQIVAETEARVRQEAVEREAAARNAALAAGGQGGGTAYQEDALRAYLAGGGADKLTLDALKSFPTRPAPARPAPSLVNLGTDSSGRPVEGVFDGNNFSRIAPPAAEGGGFESPSGKLLADADALAKAGRTEEAEALRDQAMQLRLSETQRTQIDLKQRRVATLANEISDIDQRMAAGDTRDGLPLFGTKLAETRAKKVAELAKAEADMETFIQTARRPLAGARGATPAPAAAAPASAAAPAPRFTKGQRVRQNGKTYEYDGANWNEVE
jgi:hypothetical protein